MNMGFVLKGNICHTPAPDDPEVLERGVVVCENGVCRGAFDAVPERYAHLEIIDCGDRLILPGLADLHTHAPQYAFCGTGMDYELMEWLNQVAFPEEIRYADAAYAEKAYGIFAQKLKEGATTRAVIFGTMHADATLTLMDLMERSGLISLVGKVNMDRDAPAELTEPGAEQAAADTRRFIEACRKRGYQRTGPIVTPRFVPSCTDALMERLGEIRREYDLPVQSHLSENPDEVAYVREIAPEAAFYGDAYDRFGLFGRDGRTVMAHCVYSTPEEVQRMLDNGVWVAHCPSSNMNIASGIAPVRRYLEKGLRMGLGTDVSGGSSLSMFRAVTDCIQVSKMYWRYVDRDARPLTFPEALYLATKGGGSFFGSVGSFEDGFAFDAVVLDDSAEPRARDLSVAERLERAFYRELDRTGIVMKFVRGERII
ncbi:MAG: amidohydrolase family protein [Clostridia bacterium]|nr:amidohydrolase family protein [Clostridia bacterium]